MNLSHYFFNLIRKSDGLSPDEIKSNIKNQQGKAFHVVAHRFAPTFLSSLLFWPNVELLFSAEDSFTLDGQKDFIKSLLETDRKRVVFLSTNYLNNELEDLLKLNASLVIWDQPGFLHRPSDLIKWANMAKGRIRLVAQGYNELVLNVLLGSPLSELFRKDDFNLSAIQGLADKGKEKVIIIADGFEQSEVDDFKARGATVLVRGN